jgi:type IV secretion system protein VirB10
MNKPAEGDPRLEPADDIRPVVAVSSSGLPTWAIVTAMVLAGIVLFGVLNARRRSQQAPAAPSRYLDDTAMPNQPAPLFIPPAPPPAPVLEPALKVTPAPQPQPQPTAQHVSELPRSAWPPAQWQSPAATPGPVLVIDTGEGTAASPVGNREADGSSSGGGASIGAARATVMGHRAALVPQGTLIAAVLETALDSTRAGPSRALVTRDVRGFDGSTVLIPRGSRLFGDAHSDVQPGQNRALITWTRLIRPDGVTIAIGSPSADPLGRIGVRGKVNSHFFERFGGAILQSALNIGVNLASQAANRNSTVVVALPSTIQSTTQPIATGTQIQPTLRVRQGTAITVFVARDLDFTAVQTRR